MLEELINANNYITENIKKYRKTDPLFEEFEKKTIENNIPIISYEVAEYLKFILKNGNIKNVLEIGTAVGYSGIIIAGEIKKHNGTLYTIEINEDRYKEAISNFEKFNITNVKAIYGDALEEIKKIKLEKSEDKFDLIFFDASKSHYMEFFNDSYEILNKNGIIFIDNLLFRGYIYNDYPRRFKTIVERLKKFITYLYEIEDDFVLLPFGDGVGILRKK
jgi:caffeoyl-CoA O-methyltransferase